MPEFEVDSGEVARTHGRRSAQSGRVEFISGGDRRRMWSDRRHYRRFDLTGFGWPVLGAGGCRSGRCRAVGVAVCPPVPRQQGVQFVRFGSPRDDAFEH